MPEKFETLQVGRALAAICVLLFHTEMTLQLPKYLGTETFGIFSAMHFGVAFFFVLSGFIMATAHWRELGDPAAISGYFLKRFLRIYPTLWAALLLALMLSIAVNGPNALDLKGLAIDLSIAPLSVPESLLAVEWTLRHEILFYLFFGFFIYSPRLGGVLMLGWALAPFMSQADVSQTNYSILISNYNILFIMGIGTALLYKRAAPNVAVATVSLLLGTIIFGWAWAAEVLKTVDQDSSILTPGYGLGSALAIYGAVSLERAGFIRCSPVLVLLGNASYSIYLVHFLAVSAFSKVAMVSRTWIDAPNWALFVLVATSALLFGVAFYFVVERLILSGLIARMRRSMRTSGRPERQNVPGQ